MYDCLIVDDEELLSQSTCEYFNLFSVKTHWVSNEKECFDFFKTNQAKLILLDVNLGQSSGFEICKKLRETIDIPILFISARTSDDDMLLALNIGGDDYIKKPYSLSILIAKVKAVLKRFQSVQSNTYSFGRIYIDFGLERVTRDGAEIKLKSMEYKLLCYLIHNKNKILSKNEIFFNVWGDNFVGDNTLNVHIRHLREKIEDNPNEPKYLKTLWGTGYRFEDCI